MAIRAVLLDAGGVLYNRPREDQHLTAFLAQLGLTPRHRSVVNKALRAARFDVQSGRISRDMFYDAILRFHGLRDESLFERGREVLLWDATDIELFPGVRETLVVMRDAGYLLGVVSDSAHSAREKVDWLAAHGLPDDLWGAFLVSSEFGSLKAGGMIFQHALDLLGVASGETVFVGHDSDELVNASSLGLTTIAFMPDDPLIQTDYTITSFYGLQDLFLIGKDHG